MCYFIRHLEYLIKKPPVLTKRARVSLINVKSGNALLRILPTCICSYLKSILRYKYLVLDTIIRTFFVYVSKDVRIHGYFSESKRAREQKRLINT
jgi:hypothetical protein